MKIQELAALAGVSTATVSRVFANNENVSASVRERVLQLARAHHYHPRVGVKQRNVVVITPYNAVYPVQSCVDMLLMALAQELPPKSFRMEILPVNNLDRLEYLPFCAAVSIGVEPQLFEKWNDRFAVPLILLDRRMKKSVPGVYEICADVEQGMTLAIDHLLERNCRRISCIIHGEPEHGNADLTADALKKLFARHHLNAEGRILFSGMGTENYVELTGKLLKLGTDAFFCPGGNAGIVMLYALSLYGKRVPEDISLIASEQSFFSRYAVPPQTTITPDYTELARCAVSAIEALLNNENCPARTLIPYKLLVRESVRPANK